MNPETLNTIISDCTVLKKENVLFYTDIVEKYFKNAYSPLIFIQLQYFNPFLLNISEQIQTMNREDYFKLLDSYLDSKIIDTDVKND